MKANQIKINAKVKLQNAAMRVPAGDKGGPIGPLEGIIVNNYHKDSDQTVIVEWENGTFTKENVNDLEIILSPLEKEYLQIKNKMNQGLTLLKEAEDLAQKNKTNIHDYEFEEIIEEIKQLIVEDYNNVDNRWRHSTVVC
jgi:hypothetical protein